VEHAAGVPKKGLPVPQLIGAAVVLLGGLAAAGYAVLGRGGSGASLTPEPSASAVVSAAPAPSVVAPASTAPARAKFTCQPEACEWVVCDGKNVNGLSDEIEFAPGNHDCSASRNGFGSKSLSFTATAGQTAAVNFELPPLPAATQAKAAAAAAAAKPAATAAPVAKAATPAPATKAATTAAKPAATPAPKTTAAAAATPKSTPAKSTKGKKCSTFLGCK
jgi:hypothetical protein